MKKKRILVVQGGVSNEREISLRSGKACIKALKQLKHKVIVFDPAKEPLSRINQYKKKIDLNNGLKKTVQWYKKHISLFS